jgi:uncharacterized protein (DUF1499 family)
MTWKNGLALSLILLLLSCAGTPPSDLGVGESGLRLCPESPNCVSSRDTDEVHGIAALKIAGDSGAAWTAAREIVSATSRTRIVTEDAGYLHAESTSALMRYVDDLELQLLVEDGVIAVRSASRVGYGDMGVNRERVEALRAELVAAGVVRGE